MANEFEIGTQWLTRDGRRAVVINHYINVHGKAFEAWHSETPMDNSIKAHDEDGSRHSILMDSDDDLIALWIEPPVVQERWLNIYKDGDIGKLRGTKGEADGQDAGDRIACIKIKFTEGEGLNEQ